MPRTFDMSTLLLSRADIAGLMTPAHYLEAVDAAFRLSRSGLAPAPTPMHLVGVGGGFHAKGATLMDERRLAAVKLNGNFPGNPAHGLPTIQGVILLSDAASGRLVAIMDSIEVTLRRTAAATALAARHLARPDSTSLAVIGCGAQARPQVEALVQVLPLSHVQVWDIDAARIAAFVREAKPAIGIPIEAASSLQAATRRADVVVTCTTSRSPILHDNDVAPGTFIAAVGADNPEKSEVAPSLMARAKVIADVRDQCRIMGDLHHALEAGAMTEEQLHAELGDVVTGARPGRTGATEIIVFDSTGTAIQDVASAASIYERALETGIGAHFDFG